jgi:hypothetical protein
MFEHCSGQENDTEAANHDIQEKATETRIAAKAIVVGKLEYRVQHQQEASQ